MRESRIPSPSTAEDILGARLGNLQKQIDGLTGAQGAATGTVGVPEPCTPNFALAYERIKGKIRVQCCALIPTVSASLTTTIIRDVDAVNQATFDVSLLDSENEASDEEAGAGHLEYKFGARLEPGTLYRLVRLVAHPAGGGKLKNGSLVFSDPALATFTTPVAFGVPSDPATALIKLNILDLMTVAYDSVQTFRIWAPLTDGGLAQTWGASGADEVAVVIEDFGGGNSQHHTHKLTDVELTQVDAASTPVINRGYVDVTVKQVYTPGAHLQWTKNICWIGGEKRESGGAAVGFYAGNLLTDPSTLTATSLTVVTTGDYSPKFARVDLNFTQPALPVALKNYTIERKISTDPDANYIQVVRRASLKEDDFVTTGAKLAQGDAEGIRFKPSLTYRMRVTIRAIGGALVQFTQDVTTGTDPDPAEVPGALAFPGSIGTNTVDGDPDKAQARIGITVATVSGTFAANNVRQVAFIIFRRNATDTGSLGDPLTETKTLTEAERATSSATHEFFLRMGQKYQLVAVKALNGDKATETAGTLSFTGGGVLQVDPGDAKVVPAPTYQAAAAIDGNKHVIATVRLTQDGTDKVLFKKLVIQASTGGGPFEELFEIGLKAEDTLYTTVTSFKDFAIRVHRKPSASFQLRVFAVAVGGKASANADSSVLGAGLDDGAAVPGALAFPSAPSGGNNTVDGDPDGNQARIALTIATSAGTFTANSISQIEIVLTRLDSGSSPIGNPFSQLKVLATSDLSASSCVHEFYLKIGQRFRITKVIARNGDKRTETTGTADFVAGGFILDGTCPAPSFFAQPTADGNKLASFTVRLTNNATPVLFKNLTIEVSYGGGTFRNIEGSPVGLKSDDVLNVASGTKDFVVSCKRKPGFTLDVRATARAVGALVSTTTNATQLAASASDVAVDADVPSGLVAPDLQEYFGKFDVSGQKPTTNVATLDDYQVVMSTQNTAPAGDPTVGSEGVLKIKNGQAVGFKRKTETAVALFFYFRAHNQSGVTHAPASVGWSVWSAGSTVAASGIGRPLQDVIGTGVPTLPERLEINGTSGTGHTSTTFVLSGASAVDNAYTGMALHIPSFDAAQQTSCARKITAYAGSTQTCTVNTAFDTTPSGAIAFEISRIAVANDHAGRSGITHTTGRFHLDAGDAAVSAADNFYNGWSVWIPSSGQIRRVIGYTGNLRRIIPDVAFSSIPIDNAAYVLVNGSFGYASQDLTGIIAPQSFRHYLDGDTLQDVIELLPPKDDPNGYGLQNFQCQMAKGTVGGAVRVDALVKLASSSVFRFNAPSFNPPAVVRIRLQNLYRESGSDGFSSWANWVQVSKSADPPFYDPTNQPLPIIDFQGINAWPDRYPAY